MADRDARLVPLLRRDRRRHGPRRARRRRRRPGRGRRRCAARCRWTAGRSRPSRSCGAAWRRPRCTSTCRRRRRPRRARPHVGGHPVDARRGAAARPGARPGAGGVRRCSPRPRPSSTAPTPTTIHFHEVGGVDAIVDVVGTCAALELLGVDEVRCSPIAVGLGTVGAAHGALPEPGARRSSGCSPRPARPCTASTPRSSTPRPTGAALMAASGRRLRTAAADRRWRRPASAPAAPTPTGG